MTRRTSFLGLLAVAGGLDRRRLPTARVGASTALAWATGSDVYGRVLTD